MSPFSLQIIFDDKCEIWCSFHYADTAREFMRRMKTHPNVVHLILHNNRRDLVSAEWQRKR